uniref:Major facilitator superfamily (MFS) profile domain-containing protein n=1 Tax=Biomphalaria glabrata TaxID=6526 RepID=A0A2C9K0H8_BIOGL
MTSTSYPFDDTVQLSQIMPTQDDNAPIVGNNYVANVGINGNDSQQANVSTFSVSKKRACLTVFILLLVNLLNYMDRFTVAGVLIDVKHYYHDLGNSDAGIIQTAFICTYMVFSPIFGYLGDRYTRKYLMVFGILMWSVFTLASSFIPGDMVFYFAIPVGSISTTFGGITVLAGFIGVGMGAWLSRTYKRVNPRADPLVCAGGLLTCVPFLFFALFVSKYNTAATW